MGIISCFNYRHISIKKKDTRASGKFIESIVVSKCFIQDKFSLRV